MLNFNLNTAAIIEETNADFDIFNPSKEKIEEAGKVFQSHFEKVASSNEDALSVLKAGVKSVDFFKASNDLEVCYYMVTGMSNHMVAFHGLGREIHQTFFFSKEVMLEELSKDDKARNEMVGTYNQIKAMM